MSLKDNLLLSGAIAIIFISGALLGGTGVYLEYQIQALQTAHANTINEINTRVIPTIDAKIAKIAEATDLNKPKSKSNN